MYFYVQLEVEIITRIYRCADRNDRKSYRCKLQKGKGAG